MELLFTVVWAYPNLVGSGMVFVGHSAEDARQPGPGDEVEIWNGLDGRRSGTYRTTVIEVRTNLSENPPPTARPVNRSIDTSETATPFV